MVRPLFISPEFGTNDVNAKIEELLIRNLPNNYLPSVLCKPTIATDIDKIEVQQNLKLKHLELLLHRYVLSPDTYHYSWGVHAKKRLIDCKSFDYDYIVGANELTEDSANLIAALDTSAAYSAELTYNAGVIEVNDDIDENDRDNHILSNARLVVVSPVLDSTPAYWKVKLNDRTFSARMTDEEFLNKMDKEKIAFAKNDILIADIETIITEKANGVPDVKHYIRKVHQYPKYTESKKVQQKDLF